MGQVKVILPAMGEGVFEATITKWLVSEGDIVEADDPIAEIATDKVDSEVFAPENGIVEKFFIPEGEIAKVGQAIAVISVEGVGTPEVKEDTVVAKEPSINIPDNISEVKSNVFLGALDQPNVPSNLDDGSFLSPLVRSIAEKENISMEQLKSISGTGVGGRITKDDVLKLVSKKEDSSVTPTQSVAPKQPVSSVPQISNQSFEVVEMTRMRKLIAKNMLLSKQVSPHVTSFHEVNMTPIVNWRNKNKNKFQERYGEKLTFTPIFIEAVVNAIREYPLINVSVDGDNILVKKDTNIGMATALPDGNLIVPVIKGAQHLSLSGLASKVNDLAFRARNKKLAPDEIQGGTFTITNVGTFGNLSGTPIISQPEVAILAVGTIKKVPAVIETPTGDTIGIQHQMVLSLSYDHRVVDGSLGGMFLRKVADNLEAFDTSRIV